MANSLSGISSAQCSSSRTSRAGRKRRRLVEEIVEKFLIAAVADADVSVRRSIFSLHESGDFDYFLARADCSTAVFAALNDECTESGALVLLLRVAKELYLQSTEELVVILDLLMLDFTMSLLETGLETGLEVMKKRSSWYYALRFFFTLGSFPNCLCNYTKLRGPLFCHQQEMQRHG